MKMNNPANGTQPLTADSEAARWRTTVGSCVLWFGGLLGAAIALVWEFLMWIAPPPHMHLTNMIHVYVSAPGAIFGGFIGLSAWIAGRIDPRSRRTDRRE